MTREQVLLLTGANILAWIVFHLGLSWLGTRAPLAWFDPRFGAFRPRAWERRGAFYARWLRVRQWKALLPDGAALYAGGFRKARLQSRDTRYLDRFAWETCRGEAVHWATLAAAPLFFLWNPVWAGWVMIAYAAAANLPCIAVQRYNRARMLDLIDNRPAKR